MTPPITCRYLFHLPIIFVAEIIIRCYAMRFKINGWYSLWHPSNMVFWLLNWEMAFQFAWLMYISLIVIYSQKAKTKKYYCVKLLLMWPHLASMFDSLCCLPFLTKQSIWYFFLFVSVNVSVYVLTRYLHSFLIFHFAYLLSYFFHVHLGHWTRMVT